MRNGSKRFKTPFLCEKRLSNAQEKGLREENAGYASQGGGLLLTRRLSGVPSIDKIGVVTQALLVEKDASNLQSNFLLGLVVECAFLNLPRRAMRSELNSCHDVLEYFGST